jgi:hypothetical protein
MCERAEESRENLSSRDTILYIHTSCQWRTKREKYLFRNEKRGNVRGLRVYLHAPSKPPRRDIAKTTREKRKKGLSPSRMSRLATDLFSRVNAKSKINKCELMKRLSGQGIGNGKTDSAAWIVSSNGLSYC